MTKLPPGTAFLGAEYTPRFFPLGSWEIKFMIGEESIKMLLEHLEGRTLEEVLGMAVYNLEKLVTLSPEERARWNAENGLEELEKRWQKARQKSATLKPDQSAAGPIPPL